MLEGDELDLLQEIVGRTRSLNIHPDGDLQALSNASPRLPSSTSAIGSAAAAPKPESPAVAAPGLRQTLKNTRNTFRLLKTLTSPASDQESARELQTNISGLSQVSFSELLRSLDPVTSVSKDIDAAKDVHIGPGMAQHTELGRAIDEFGVRRIYPELLKNLVAATQLRIEAGHGLLLSDYKVLLRCAGAASDLHMAKKIWHLMETRDQLPIRDGDAYNEFIKARFLTDPLYTQFDMAKFRVSPANMHKQKIWLSPRQLTAIRNLRRNILAHQSHRFGQNRYAPEKAEALVRILRKTKPVRRVFLRIVHDGVAVDEKLLCSAMVAFARNGALRFIKTILWKYWKIKVHTNKETREITIAGGTTMYRPDSPMYPTTRLLDAIVESFCCNAEVTTALKLLGFISSRYNIPILNETWSKLLQWTYVQSSRPASTEWKLANWPEKIVRPDTVQLVWDTMVSEPYNMQPRFDDHIVLIKSLLSQGRLKDSLQRMLELQPTYARALADLEDAFYEHVYTSRLGVDTAQSLARWLEARSRKQAMWYSIQTCCRQLLGRVRSNRLDDVMTVHLLPQLVDAFRPFFARSLRYRTATGLVEIHNPSPIARLVTTVQTVELPALVTQDLAAAPVQARAGPADGRSQSGGQLVTEQEAHRASDPSRAWRRENVRLGQGIASRVLDTVLREKKPSQKQLQQEFA